MVTGRNCVQLEPLEARQLLTAQLIDTFQENVRQAVTIGGYQYVAFESDGFSSSQVTQLVRRNPAGGVDRVVAASGRNLLNFGVHFDSLATARRLFFIADQQLWTIRGGSVVAVPLLPDAGITHRTISGMTEHRGSIYFRVARPAGDGRQGSNMELWKTDGTPEGTLPVKSFSLGLGDVALLNLVSMGSMLYFDSRHGGAGSQIWSTDGTSAGTAPLIQFADGSAGSLIAVENRLFFTYSTAAGASLYISDGTSSGTKPVRGRFNHIRPLAALGSRLFFVGSDAKAGCEVWMTDTSSAAPKRITDLERGPRDGLAANQPLQTATVGEDLYFSTYELTPNTPAEYPTPRLVKIDARLRPTIVQATEVRNLFQANGKVYFSGRHGDVWISNGTPGGTHRLGILAKHLFRDGMQALFSANAIKDGGAGRNLWRILPDRAAAEGRVWNDVNGNGKRDRSEPQLPGFRVFADFNGDGVCNRNEPFTRTDSLGRWRLDDLPAGTWIFRVTPVAGWTPTTATSVEMALTREHTTSAADMGMQGAPGSIAGTVFHDLNFDGRQDADEPGLAQFRVFIDENENGRWDSTERSVRTDSNGRFSFLLIASRRYVLRVVHVQEWGHVQDHVVAEVVVNPGLTSNAAFPLFLRSGSGLG